VNRIKKVVMCERKFKHRLFSAAEKHLERLLNDSNVTEPKRLHIYACPLASKTDPHWHVGHYQKAEYEKLVALRLL